MGCRLSELGLVRSVQLHPIMMPTSTHAALAATLSVLTIVLPGSASAQQWKVTALEDPPGAIGTQVCGISNNGSVAGISNFSGVQKYIRWTKINGTYQAQVLGVLQNTVYASGCSINGIGTIVGSNRQFTPTIDKTTAVVWSGNSPTPLQTPADYNFTLALGINNTDKIVGYATKNIDLIRNLTSAVLWSGLSPTVLVHLAPSTPQSYATAVNSAGVVTGWSFNGSGNSGVLWFGPTYNQPPQPLPSPVNSRDVRPLAINSAGTVVGIAWIDPDPNLSLEPPSFWAYVWSNGQVSPLPILDNTDKESAAGSINDIGDIVGSVRDAQDRLRPVLWRGGAAIDLIANSDFLARGWEAYGWAVGINNQGQIAGNGIPVGSGGFSRGFVLTPALDVELVDPVPFGGSTSLLVGAAITKDKDKLRQFGRVVHGIAADGVAQVVLRIKASAAGQNFTVQVDPSQCVARTGEQCVEEYGRIFDPINPPSDIFSSTYNGTVSVTSQATPDGPMAFVAYRAPSDFARSMDPNFATLDKPVVWRDVSINIGAGSSYKVRVIRPPVVLVHGLWADAKSYGGLMDLMDDSRLQVFPMNYGVPVIFAKGSPSSPAGSILASPVTGSSLGVNFGAAIVERDYLKSVLPGFKDGKNPLKVLVAAVGGDFVAHSMGTLVAKILPNRDPSEYYSSTNYRRGYIHKLITIGGTHLGAPIAKQVLRDENTCIRNMVAWSAGFYAFGDQLDSVHVGAPLKSYFPGSTTQWTGSGAVGDLKGEVDGSGLSPANQTIRSKLPSPPIPMAFISGAMSTAQIDKLLQAEVPMVIDETIDGIKYKKYDPLNGMQRLRLMCMNERDPLASQVSSPSAFTTFMSYLSDGLVTVVSQTNGEKNYPIGPIVGKLHSPGTGMLFNIRGQRVEPTLLDSDIVPHVMSLLNTSNINDGLYRKRWKW